MSSALIAERIRWRRDQERDESQTRRVVYSDFPMALSQAHSDMRTVVLQPDRSTGDRLYGDLHQALDGSGVWRLRQSLSLTASAEIIELAVRACDTLTQMRDGLVVDPDLMNSATAAI